MQQSQINPGGRRAKILLQASGSAAVLVMLVLTAPAYAQTAKPAPASDEISLEEIVVTARQRSENLQDTPFSIAAVTAEKLKSLNVVTTMDLDNKVPGLALRPDNTRVQPFVGIRGVGDISRNPGIDNRTGLYLDGVPLGRSSSVNYPIFDIENIEVLRGPQGTLFGNNSLTGVMSIHSQMPTFEDSGRLTVATGSRNLFSGSGFLNEAVSDDLAVRATIAGQSQDGYYKNLNNGKTAGGGVNFAGRLQVRYAPTSDTTIDFSADGVSAKDDILLGVGSFSTGPMVGLPAFRFNHNVQPHRDRTIYGASLTVEHTLPKDFQLTSISSYRQSKDTFAYDGDGSPSSLFSVGFRYRDWDISQELRIASPKNEHYDYVVGVFYYQQNPSEVQDIRLGADYPVAAARGAVIGGAGKVKSEQIAAFAHGTLRPTTWLSIDGGLRYQDTTKKALKVQEATGVVLGYPAMAPTRLKLSEDSLNPLISVTVEPIEDIKFYGLYSTGDRAGGFNMDVVKTLSGIGFDAESVKNYEVGMKAELFNRRVRLNIAAYTERFKDFQQSQNIIDPNPAAGTLPTVISIISNAASVRSEGVEVDFDAAVSQGFTVAGGFGFNHAFYNSFPNGGGPGVDYTGNLLIEAPRFQGSITFDYKHELTEQFDGHASLTISGRSKVYSQPANNDAPFNDNRYREEGFATLSGRLTATRRDGGLALSVFGRNLTNERHSDAAAPVTAGYLFKGLNEPRTVGIELTLRR